MSENTSAQTNGLGSQYESQVSPSSLHDGDYYARISALDFTIKSLPSKSCNHDIEGRFNLFFRLLKGE